MALGLGQRAPLVGVAGASYTLFRFFDRSFTHPDRVRECPDSGLLAGLKKSTSHKSTTVRSFLRSFRTRWLGMALFLKGSVYVK